MCLGIPGQIIEISDAELCMAKVDVCGIKREINVSLVADSTQLHTLKTQWVLVHVGFAMSLLDEEKAHETLTMLEAMGQLDHEKNDFEQLENS